MQAMIRQAQKMQEDMAALQEELDAREYDVSAGGGVVAVKINGKKEILKVTIAPEVVDPDDVETLEDLIVAAISEAMNQAEADAAEAEHARTQKKIDRLKAAFIGSKLTIIRIILSILPIAALMLPLASISYNGPFIEATSTQINAIKIYEIVSSLDFDGLFTMMGSGIVGSSFTGYFVALAGILLSLVFVIVSLVMLTMSCGKLGNIRNFIFNGLAIAGAGFTMVTPSPANSLITFSRKG